MCETCGCGDTSGTRIHGPGHRHADGTWHEHEHDHEHDHDGEHPDGSNHHAHHHNHHTQKDKKSIDLGVDILSHNNITAGMNRQFLRGRKVVSFNLVSSPGSGKTTLLEKTITGLQASAKIYVIEGDQQTVLDADRIRNAGAPAIQVNTGSGCHLDASMVEKALDRFDPEMNSILFIENVGNLVCPAMFDLGEFRRAVVISVTEGDDKPLKYPYMFQTSHMCIINKSDLLPYVNFSVDNLKKNALSVNPEMKFLITSATGGEGMEDWYNWLKEQAELFSRNG
jgi:hydrogenase nickel incorporation protein HypB